MVGDINIQRNQNVVIAAALSTVFSNVVSNIADQSVQNALKNVQDQSQSQKAIGADLGPANMKTLMIIGGVVAGLGVLGACVSSAMHHKKKPLPLKPSAPTYPVMKSL